MNRRFDGKVAFLAGATSGIGGATALAFAGAAISSSPATVAVLTAGAARRWG